MKAAVLKAFGSPLAVETVPDPVLGTGEVIVDVVAAGMLAYAGDVFSGKRQVPAGAADRAGPGRRRPGAGGRAGRDAARGRRLGVDRSDGALARRCRVARHHPAGPDGRQPGGAAPAALLSRRRLRRAGARADRECQSDRRHRSGRRRPLVRARHAARTLRRLAGRPLLAGETLLVNGATGAFGSAGVAVGIAMGAGGSSRRAATSRPWPTSSAASAIASGR